MYLVVSLTQYCCFVDLVDLLNKILCRWTYPKQVVINNICVVLSNTK